MKRTLALVPRHVSRATGSGCLLPSGFVASPRRTGSTRSSPRLARSQNAHLIQWLASRVGVLVFLLPLIVEGRHPPAAAFHEVMRWHLADMEISQVKFAAHQAALALVTRFHWPDGHEAESVADEYFTKLEVRAKAEPRFADPQVRLLDMKGKELATVSYGWNPSFSPDEKRLAFSAQKKPITGQRALAEGLEGNEIQVFDRHSKQITTVAAPTKGFLDTPVFSGDGKTLVFSYNAATNGDYSGMVGVGQVDLSTKKVIELSSPDKTRGYFNEISLFQLIPAGVFAVRAIPAPKEKQEYIADHYRYELWQLFPTSKQVFSFGTYDLAHAPGFQESSDQTLLVLQGFWRIFFLDRKQYAPGVRFKNTGLHSLYSPDRRFFVETAPEEEPTQVVLYDVTSGAKRATWDAQGEIQSLTWHRW